MIDLFEEFDFNQLENFDFKEDSVREILILPIIKELGYTQTQIIRSKALKHPFIKIGSQKRAINIIPDYLFKIDDNYAWVLDAKAPNENIREGENVEQVYSYSMHPEVRTKFFALCNGRHFSLFRQDISEPILYFSLSEIKEYWELLTSYISAESFQSGKAFNYQTVKRASNFKSFNYLERPLLEEIKALKQSTKRHFGVHGYFTKQVWNVVAEYIKNFSQKGDVVLDPFGGSGITAIEAMMNDRQAIHIDLNPLSFFLVDSLVVPVDYNQLKISFEKIVDLYKKFEPKTESEIDASLKKYQFPKGIKLPKASDVDVIEDLFSKKQLAQLGLLKNLIKKEKDINIKKSLLLMFSGLVTKINRTYHTSKFNDKSPGGGDCAAFRYYRYRIAPKPVELDLMKYFELRYKKVVNAKKEFDYKINADTLENLKVVLGTATNLDFIHNESIDYIYTDPPYGKKIPYLDLSIMWNSWLDLKVTEKDYELEAIEGGEHSKSKQEYNDLISLSIKEMYRVLKYDRWMSFVFAHKDPEFWHLIIETAERCGFEYAGAVAQKNGQTSFKKRQNPFTVLSGQLIINFKKVRKPRNILKASLGMDISEIVIQTIEGLIASKNGATLEQINDELIIKGLELGFLDLLKKQYTDLTPLLLDAFDYDDKEEIYTIKKNGKFRSNIDVRLRVRYYLISYLRRMEILQKDAKFDEIILSIMPLLKNGVTPEEQTILSVLEDIAYKTGNDSWLLKNSGQMTLNI